MSLPAAMGSTKKAKYKVPRSNNQRKKKRRKRRKKASNVNLVEEAPGEVRMPDCTLQNLDASEALAGKPSSSVLDKFSQNKMESIIEAVMNHLVIKQEEWTVPQHHQNQEQLAQGLAAAVIEGALVQIDASWNGAQTSKDGKMDAAEACFSTSEQDMESQSRQSNLVQSGLPPMGSLDYPDAPPTTPLILDLERGRDSFARKLKGGLAKVFLPSPPPPTPMDGQAEPASALNDAQGELMEYLMRSLPRNDSVGLDVVDRGHFEEDVEVFAEVLSCSIINSALRAAASALQAGRSRYFIS